MVNADIKKILFIGFCSLSLMATESNFGYTQNKNSIVQSFIDSDLDGVSDIYDRCPNTPFLEIVDANGCAKNQKPVSSYYIWVSSAIVYTERKYPLASDSSEESQGGKHNGWQHGKRKKLSEKRVKYRELYLPFSIFLSEKNWLYSLTAGYIEVKDGDKKSKSVSDTAFSVGYLFDLSDKGLPVFSLKTKVKIPTSKLSHKSDYTFQWEMYKSFKRDFLFLDVGYTALGSLNGYKNLYYFDADYSRSFKKFDLGVVYSFSKNTHSGKSLQNITLYFTKDLREDLKIYGGYTRDFFDSRDYKSFVFSVSKSF